ncbi:MAG TPA: RDD family protein [Pyrinomonadaceae bacterium]|nr:RDD family protein [Pyrinomonadaceae bacterium]
MSLRLEQDRPVAPSPRDARSRAYVSRDEAAETESAPFTLRCGALLIDYILLAGVLAFATLLARLFGDMRKGSAVVLMAGYIAVGVVALLNFVLVAGLTGRTLGKWVTGLRVERRSDGTRVSFARALVRHTIGYALTAATLGLGFLLAAFNSRGRALHDIVAGTVVVRSRVARVPLR